MKEGNERGCHLGNDRVKERLTESDNAIAVVEKSRSPSPYTVKRFRHRSRDKILRPWP